MGNYLGEATEACAPRDPTAFDAANEAFTSVSVLCERLQSVVDRIAGHAQPSMTKAGGSDISPVSNGRLQDLRDRAYKASSVIRSAHEAIERLEAQI